MDSIKNSFSQQTNNGSKMKILAICGSPHKGDFYCDTKISFFKAWIAKRIAKKVMQGFDWKMNG